MSLPSPYEAPDLYDLAFDDIDFDIPFWIAEGWNGDGPVLEIGCGTGRVLLPLLEAGLDAEGLDESRPMLNRLKAKAEVRDLHPVLHLKDMRRFRMKRRYRRIFIPFNGFAHAETQDDQLAVLRCCRRNLAAGGAVVIHMSYPGQAYWSGEDGRPELEIEAPIPGTKNTIRLFDTRRKDRVRQIQDSIAEYQIVGPGGDLIEAHKLQTRQRWVYLHEFELLFRCAGFARWNVLGGFEREPLERDDQQMVAYGWAP